MDQETTARTNRRGAVGPWMPWSFSARATRPSSSVSPDLRRRPSTNSMILHELYFDGLGEGGEPDTALREALARDFGSVERWRTEFVAMGKAMGGGSGWVLLTYSPRDRRLVNQWAADHTHSLAGGTPILALDMYEHSYHLDYGAAAAKYVDAFMENITWRNVARLHQAYVR